MAIVEVTDASFEAEVLRADRPVLVDLHADWCQPCKQMAPIIAEIDTEIGGAIKVAKVNIDHNPMVAQTFRVQSIPMLLVMDQGKVVQHHMGVLDKAGILRLLEPVMPRSEAELKPAELAQLIAQGRVVPIDIRDANSYSRYRIPTAIHIAADKLPEHAKELLATDGRVRVLYGRGGDEAKALVEELVTAGVQVGYLAGGFLHWEADGLEVERG